MRTRKTSLNLAPCYSAAKRVARFHGLRADAADDVAQATAVIVLRKYAERPRTELAKIAAGVAHRVVLKLWEKSARNSRAIALLANRARRGGSASTDDQLTSERGDLLRHALGSLSDNDKALLRMKYGEGMSNSEIAKSLGSTSKVVKVRMSRATSRLGRAFRTLDSEQ